MYISVLLYTLPSSYIIIHLSVRESGRSREAIGPVLKKLLFLWFARVGRYTKEPTDTTGNGTSPGLRRSRVCNSAGQKLDQEHSLYVAAWRRRTSAIQESRLSMDGGRQFYSKSLLLGAPKAEAAR